MKTLIDGVVYDLPDPPTTQLPKLWIPVSPRQFRQALNAVGQRAAVEAAIAAADQDTKDWYEFATSFERNHPTVIAMATALAISPAEVDAVFDLAATL